MKECASSNKHVKYNILDYHNFEGNKISLYLKRHGDVQSRYLRNVEFLHDFHIYIDIIILRKNDLEIC